ncbi:hypothetical protein HHK36_033301 [Tetracentron sinense]|uniref:Uncharacterized protein n=1 Tax=Tetracentron sinense TaxID=13715 RepID=A0A834Y3M7_TETSI|nr:hypothetical protein HHK36_033301 [Tetracentron sinense]
MGRPPCCDKVGIKKGPWTPEEDIILVSYIQEHGPRNWRSVTTNTALDPHMETDSNTCQLVSKGYCEKRSLEITNQTSIYASSTENISRLLEGWMRTSPKSSTLKNVQEKQQHSNWVATPSVQCYKAKAEEETCDLISNEEFESLLSLENLSSLAWENSSTDPTLNGPQTKPPDEMLHVMSEKKQRLENHAPVSFIEKWLLDETSGHAEEVVVLSPIDW